MARITVENCIDKVKDRFELVILSANRAKSLAKGSPALIDKAKDKSTVLALREIEQDKLDIKKLYDDVLISFRHNVEYKETEENTKELEFIEKEIIGEAVFQDETQFLTNVGETELDTVMA